MGGLANKACGICGGDGILSQSHTDEGWDYEECPCARNEAIESMEMSGYDLKEQGCEQVMGNTPESIKEKVFKELDALIELQPYAFTTDDLHRRCEKLLKQAHANFVGSTISSARKRGLIEWTGRVDNSTRPERRGGMIKVWRAISGKVD